METDNEKELSVSQSADNPEAGAVPEVSSGQTETNSSEDSTKIIKASKESKLKGTSEEAIVNGDAVKDNGNPVEAKENGELSQENGAETKENGESVTENEDSVQETGEKAFKENGESVKVNEDSVQKNGEAAKENEEATSEPTTEKGENKAEETGQQVTEEEGTIDAVQTITPPSEAPVSNGQKEEADKGESQEPEQQEMSTEQETQEETLAPTTEDLETPALDTQALETTQKEETTEDISKPAVEAAAVESNVSVDEENNTEKPDVETSVPEETTEDVIRDELTTDEPVTEVQDAIDVDQVQVKIALNTDEMECVLENVAMVGDQVSNAAEHDPMEEDLESFAPAPVPIPVKEEKTLNQDNQEQVLVDDEEMVITQITNLDELDPNVSVETNSDGQTKVIITTPVAPVTKAEGPVDIDQFTDTEDLVIYALDTISPFDAKFISQHMADRDEHQIERRLVDNAFRKKSFNFQKLPLMMFEMVFVSESNERMPNLMILTQRQLLQLTPKGSWCQYGPGIETIEMHYTNKTRFGIDTSALCEFIITNIPNMHMPYLRRNVREIEGFMETSNINFRKVNSSKKDLKQILNRAQSELTMDTLRIENMPLIKIDEEAVLHLKEEHEEMLVKIVKSVGRRNWEEVTKLLIAVFEYEVDVDIDDEEIYDKVRYYFETKLDPNLRSGQFTEDEDKCIIFMYKYWSKIMEDEEVWSNIARHLEGRTGNQVKNRFQRKSGCPTDLTLNNILTYPDDPTNPATFNNDLAHMFSLTIVKKNIAPELEITTKLQYEDSFLVMGTVRELYIRPCRDTSIKTKYPGIVQHNFTYDPTRPPQQFLTFVKLTFGNGLKKLGLLDDPEAFNFNNIEYNGPTIHELISAADQDRFVVPKDIFMLINRRMEGDQVVEFVLPVKRKYTRKIDRLDLHQRDEFQREQIKIRSTPPSAKKPRRK